MRPVFAIPIIACLFSITAAAGEADITPFSQAQPGIEIPRGWQPMVIPRKAPSRFSLVSDADVTVLRAQAIATVGMLGYTLRFDPASRPLLTWRWKVDHVLTKADLGIRAGDDFAARVYVFFDVPLESLPFTARAKMQFARVIYGTELPIASLCYVWDNQHIVGTSVWSAYTDRVRIIVLESGPEKTGQWVTETRDIAADFKAAYGHDPPAVTGIAIGNDSDQTGETALAWFGDFSFGTKP
jgi:hypothetical protein